jgi:histidine phosphotransferase ChpT
VNDLRLCELMAARICHDLVGPVGAVSNGVELLGQDGAGADPEVLRLIGTSVRAASQRLQAFRVAFGSANAIPRTGCIGAVRELALGLVEEGKATLDWPAPSAEVEAMSDKTVAKLVLNLVLIALESMLRGGTVRVELTAADRTLTAVIQGAGGQGKIADEVRAGLEGLFDFETSTPKAAPAYLAALLARELGGSIAIGRDPGVDFQIRVRLPARA